MKKAFVSYSRDDFLQVEEIGRALQENGVTIWRDQQSLYGGQQWPKAIGEAIDTNDFFLLIWSKNAAESQFVEFEWTTAIALRKAIIPCLLDDTPLPPSLRGIHGIIVEGLHEALPRLLAALQTPLSESTPKQHSIEVIHKLQKIMVTDPKKVVRQAKAIFNQKGWSLQGNVYQAADDILLTIQQPEGAKEKSRFDPWVKITGLVATILAIAIALFTLSDKISEKFFPETPTSYLRGIVRNVEGDPIANVIVKIQELPDISVSTTNYGGFYFSKIPGDAGDRVRIFVEKKEYKDYNEYVTLPGPVSVILEK